MGRLFGTDGVRGIANSELTAELAYKLGRAGAHVIAAEAKHRPRIVVGMDTRISCSMLEAALVSGICSMGAEAVSLGTLPTPAVAYLTRKYSADAGVVISASHNPFEYNGIKFFNNKGYKLADEVEEKIEAIILDNSEELPMPEGNKVGFRSEIKDAGRDYIDFLKSTIKLDLKGIKIALDCANGAASELAPILFSELGADICVINNQPDGININCNCGSTHMEGLQKFVLEHGADVGVAFDGDADRMLAVDEKGKLIDGDIIMSIIGLAMKKENNLKRNSIVVTVMSNLGMDIMAGENGINLVKTKVGDRYVLEAMLEKGCILGGEQSGHVIFLEHNTTGDGMLTALKLLESLKSSGKHLSELASVMKVYPQVIKNAKVKNENKEKYMNDELIACKCRELEEEFHGEGRVLIRPSGTEPLIRVMIEGQDANYIAERASELARLIEERLG